MPELCISNIHFQKSNTSIFHWEAFPIPWLAVLLFTHLDGIGFLAKWDRLELGVLFVQREGWMMQ